MTCDICYQIFTSSVLGRACPKRQLTITLKGMRSNFRIFWSLLKCPMKPFSGSSSAFFRVFRSFPPKPSRSFYRCIPQPSTGSSGAFYRVFQSLLQGLPEPFLWLWNYQGYKLNTLLKARSISLAVPSLPVFWSLPRVFRSLPKGLPELLMANLHPRPVACQTC